MKSKILSILIVICGLSFVYSLFLGFISICAFMAHLGWVLVK